MIVVGSIVRLKTGGPNMTVEDAQDCGRVVDCVWFERVFAEAGATWRGPLRESFAPEMLEEPEPSSESFSTWVTRHCAPDARAAVAVPFDAARVRVLLADMDRAQCAFERAIRIARADFMSRVGTLVSDAVDAAVVAAEKVGGEVGDR